MICLPCYYRQAKKVHFFFIVTALKCLFIEFLLQVFDKTEKKIRIYDNTRTSHEHFTPRYGNSEVIPFIICFVLHSYFKKHFMTWVQSALSPFLSSRDAFRNVDSLDGWTVCNPQQWRRNDGNNCGVFVCSVSG